MSVEGEEADQCIRMLSFCKRHRQTSTACLGSEDRIKSATHKTSEYLPPPNPSGCARTGMQLLRLSVDAKIKI